MIHMDVSGALSALQGKRLLRLGARRIESRSWTHQVLASTISEVAEPKPSASEAPEPCAGRPRAKIATVVSRGRN